MPENTLSQSRNAKTNHAVTIATLLLTGYTSTKAFITNRQLVSLMVSKGQSCRGELRPINMVLANVLDKPATRIETTQKSMGDCWQNAEEELLVIEPTVSRIAVDTLDQHDLTSEYGSNESWR